MDHTALEATIKAAWETRDTLTPATRGKVRDAVETVLAALDAGQLRVAERGADGRWLVKQWAKKAVLLGFRLRDMEHQSGGAQGGGWWDKVDSKFKGWGETEWRAAGFRAVHGAVVRHSAFIAKGVVLMPSFVNLGAHVGEGTMVDTWATVGSCAQIGRNVHLSGGVGIGGVLEPMQVGRRSSKTIASSGPARRWWRAVLSAKAQFWGWAFSSASQPRSWTARAGR